MQLNKWSFVLAGIALHGASVQAANLIQNPDFDNALTAWTTSAGTSLINNTDGSPSVPSAQLSTTPILGGSDLLFTQCVLLTGSPPPWDFGIRTRVVGSPAGSCLIEIYSVFATGTCGSPVATSSVLASTQGTVAGVQGSFTQYANTTSDPMPGGNSSQIAELNVSVTCAGGLASMTLNVDHAYLGTTGTAPVRLQSFDVK